MNVFVVALAGGAAGIGLLMIAAGLRGRPVVSLGALRDGRFGRFTDRVLLRTALALACGAVGLWMTHWAVLGIVGCTVGWLSPTWQALRGAHGRELALVEAIATWTEQVRDAMSAANGLEQALAATVELAPDAIAAAVSRLALRSEVESLPDALRRFAEELDHALSDFVVAALLTADAHEARELGALLGLLADTARDEVRMRIRVWVARARTRTATRMIGTVVVVMVVGLLVFDRPYLEPYDAPGGQVVLGVVMSLFAASYVAMQRIGRIELPQRFIARRDDLGEAR